VNPISSIVSVACGMSGHAPSGLDPQHERPCTEWIGDWIRLKKELATLGEELPPAETYQPRARNRVQIQVKIAFIIARKEIM